MSTTSHSTSGVAWKTLLSKQYLPKVSLLALALWLHASNSTLTSTTIPAVVADIGGINLISWAFSLYLMGSILAGASIALVIEKHGMSRSMLTAAAVYLIGCLLCASSLSMYQFLLGRTLQGTGGGGLVALIYVFQNRYFPNQFIPRLVGVLSMIWMMSAFSGPLIGGIFATLGLWRYAFLVFAVKALILMCLVLKLVSLDDAVDSSVARRIPFLNICLLSGSVLLVSLAGAVYRPVYSELLVLLGVLTLIWFIRRDNRRDNQRLLPRGVLHWNHPVCSGLFMTFALNASLMSFLVYGPLILIKVYGLTPLSSGFVLLTETLAWSLAAIACSGVRQDHEPRLILLGTSLVTLGIVGQAMVVPATNIAAIVFVLLLASGGFGMVWGYIIRRITASAAESERNRTSAAIPVTQQLGFALGAAFVGVLANGQGLTDQATASELSNLAPWLFLGFLPIALLGNLAAWRFITLTRGRTTPSHC